MKLSCGKLDSDKLERLIKKHFNNIDPRLIVGPSIGEDADELIKLFE